MGSHDFATHLAEDRRLVLLRILAEMPGSRSNSSEVAPENWSS